MLNPTRRQIILGGSMAVALAPALAPARAAPKAGSSRDAAASSLAKRLFAAKPAPALSLAVARADRVLWAEALGQADLERSVSATTEHSFCLGSVSKVITSAAAAKLVSRNILDLDAPVTRWLSGLPEQHRNTTMRQLLTHRGGIRHYNRTEVDIASKGGAIYMRPYASDADVLALFINDPLIATPGTSVKYSSYGYTLASLAMQAAAGRKFPEIIHQEIALPFGLTSLVADDPWAVVPSRAGKYMSAPDIAMLCAGLPENARPVLTNGWANMPFANPAYCWAGAGFLMSPSHAARFGAALLDSKHSKVTAAERALLFTPMTEATSGSPPLGLGWRVDHDKKGRLCWHHAGATTGSRYSLTVYPQQGLSIALAANVMKVRLDVAQAASDLVDIYA
jgi:CubicO group peptidase (beta-lactamase class C family)